MSFSWLLSQPHPSVHSAEDLAQIGDNQSFETREEAEEWLGQAWPELEEIGVEAVTLLSNDETVYGPMPLSQG